MSHKKTDKQHIDEELDFDNTTEPRASASGKTSSEKTVEEPLLTGETQAHLEEALTLSEKKAHEHWEKAVRALAELENVRRRAERDVEHAHRYGLEKVLKALIPVVDSLEQALEAGSQEVHGSMYEGLVLTLNMFIQVLEKHDVKRLDPVGQPFNPQEHEAMSMSPSTDVPPNTVLVVFQKGYKLHDRVVRPARVIVSKEG